jgi:hypothetical protein
VSRGEFHGSKSPKGPGYRCHGKIDVQVKAEVWQLPCGWCPACLAVAKRDRTGRSAAEAITAAEMVIYTLTYAPGIGDAGAKRFIAKHRSDFVKRLRARFHYETCLRLGLRKRALTAADRARVYAEMPHFVYNGCGERGEKNGRCHWHVILYFDRASGIEPCKRSAKGHLLFERRDEWEWGNVTIDKIDEVDNYKRVRAASYPSKYLDKSRGVSRRLRGLGSQPDAVFFQSNSRPVGSLYICEEARRTARAGLPYRGLYSVPGLLTSKAQRRDLSRLDPGIRDRVDLSNPLLYRHLLLVNQCMGVTATLAIKAFKETWSECWPGRPYPLSDFMRTRDPDFVASDYAGSKAGLGVAETAKPVKPLQAKYDRDRVGYLNVAGERGASVGMIEVHPSGVAVFTDTLGAEVFLPSGDLQKQLPMIGQAARERVEWWLVQRRGADWLSPPQRAAAAFALLQAKRAAILRFAKPSPNVNADRPDLPVSEAETAMRRRLRLGGEAYYQDALVGDDPGRFKSAVPSYRRKPP